MSDSQLKGDDKLVVSLNPNLSSKVCITPGANGKLDSIRKADDKISGLGVSNDPNNFSYLLYKGICWWKPKKTVYGSIYGDTYNLKGIEGQGNPEPPELFYDHAVVIYTYKNKTKIYDPSYGNGPYEYSKSGIKEYENSAISGYAEDIMDIKGKPREYIKARKNDKTQIEITL